MCCLHLFFLSFYCIFILPPKSQLQFLIDWYRNALFLNRLRYSIQLIQPVLDFSLFFSSLWSSVGNMLRLNPMSETSGRKGMFCSGTYQIKDVDVDFTVASGKEAFVLQTLDGRWSRRRELSQRLRFALESKFTRPTCSGFQAWEMSKRLALGCRHFWGSW